jgi:spermidine/putrescine transport system permease protein
VKKNYGLIYSAPIAVWITVFFVCPIMIIVLYSFLQKGLYGGVEMNFSLEAYRALMNPVFGRVAFNTFIISLISTVIVIVITLPCGLYMARSKNKNVLLTLVVIPFWTNFLIRIYAWIAILGNNGIINEVLHKLKLADHYVPFLYNETAVILVLVYAYLPYAIMPLYSTMEKFDFSLLEAARDLGASHTQSLRKIMLPNIRGGIVTAILFTFIPIFGAYAVPLLVGGKDSFMLGNIIADQITKTRNWPLASAISMVITLVTTVGLLGLMYVQKRQAQAQKEEALKAAEYARNGAE